MSFWNTRTVAKMLGVPTWAVDKAVSDGRCDPPAKSPAGNYLWAPADVERLSWAIRKRPADDVLRAEAQPAAHG